MVEIWTSCAGNVFREKELKKERNNQGGTLASSADVGGAELTCSRRHAGDGGQLLPPEPGYPLLGIIWAAASPGMDAPDPAGFWRMQTATLPGQSDKSETPRQPLHYPRQP